MKPRTEISQKYRRALGIRILYNPFYFTRADLWGAGILPAGRPHPIFKKMRSVLRTYTLWTDAPRWGDIGRNGITAIGRAIVARSVNLDLGMPARLVGEVGERMSILGQIYHLLKHDCYIALEPV